MVHVFGDFHRRLSGLSLHYKNNIMNNLFKHVTFIALLGLSLSSCNKNDDHELPGENENLEITLASGDSSAVIGKINQFREKTGNQINVTSLARDGRREINWDGVPAEFVSPLLFPTNFFNPTETTAPDGRKRGLVFTPANAALLVSDKRFAEIDSAFKNQFTAFSKTKLFSSKGTIITEINFQLPGTKTPAFITSFGLVFSDVDNADATTVEIFKGTKLIVKAKAQAANKKFSFVGLHTLKSRITSVKITCGNIVLAPGVQDGSAKDVVVMDDFIYSEPKAL
jgi:hypothetical protein